MKSNPYEEPHACSQASRGETVEGPNGVDVNWVLASHCAVNAVNMSKEASSRGILTWIMDKPFAVAVLD
jgi:hypothetical protein